MPVRQGKDKKGKFYRWGGRGKKYYFSSRSGSRERAKRKASKQGQAAHAHGYTG